MNPVNETELGREVRAAVAAALKRFGDNDIAAVKVSTLRIGQLSKSAPPPLPTSPWSELRSNECRICLSGVRCDRGCLASARQDGVGSCLRLCARRAALLWAEFTLHRV